MRTALHLIVVVVLAGLVGGLLKRVLPEEVFGFSKVVTYGPAVFFVVALGIYPICGKGIAFRSYLLRVLLGLGIALLAAMGLDKLW